MQNQLLLKRRSMFNVKTDNSFTITFKNETIYITSNSTTPSQILQTGQEYVNSFYNSFSGYEILSNSWKWSVSGEYLKPPEQLGSSSYNPSCSLTIGLSGLGQKVVKSIELCAKWDEMHLIAKEIKVNDVPPVESISSSSSPDTILTFPPPPQTEQVRYLI